MRTPRLSPWVLRKSSPFGCKFQRKKHGMKTSIRETYKVGPGKPNMPVRAIGARQNMVTFLGIKKKTAGEISRKFLFLIFDPSKIPSLTNSENGFTSTLQGGPRPGIGGIGGVKFHPSETPFILRPFLGGPMSLHFKLKGGPSL